MEDKKIKNLYNNIKTYEETDEEELEEKLEENIVALYHVMDNFEDELCDKMKERVAEVKEYIELLKKRAERGKNGRRK